MPKGRRVVVITGAAGGIGKALVGLTRSLALELAPEVRVNAILPAATHTPMLLQGFAEDLEGFSALGSYHPLGRTARPAEIAAAAALFLAEAQASFITGAALELDGGIGGCPSDPPPKRKKSHAPSCRNRLKR